MTISIDPLKVLEKNSTSVHNKENWSILVIYRTYLNIIKVIYDKSTTNITLNSEKLKVFPLRFETTQVCQHSLFLFNIETGSLTRANRQEKEIFYKNHTNRNREIQAIHL